MAAITEVAESFTGATNGTTVSTGNTIFFNVSGSAVGTFSNTVLDTGLSGKLVSTANIGTWRANINTPRSQVHIGFFWRPETTDLVYAPIQVAFGNTDLILTFRQQADNTLLLRDGTTTRYTSTFAVVPGTVYWVYIKCQPGTASTGMRMKLYSTTGTLLVDSGNQTCNTVAATTVDNFRIGILSGNPTTTTYFDKIVADDATEPTPPSSPIVPSAGADQTGIEPYATVTLTGSATGGSGSLTYTWTQLTGTTVSLSGSGASRTFIAAPTISGETPTFRVSVTDGVTTQTDDVAITVLPHNFWAKAGGTWVARQVRTKVAGTFQ